jgi:SH3-like domain-containing protein
MIHYIINNLLIKLSFKILLIAIFVPQFASATASKTLFMSLKSNQVLMRVGPGKIYPAIWEYQVRGLPMQIIGQHNDNEWLQVRDPQGEIGWIYGRLLSSTRTAIVLHDGVLLHSNPDNNSKVIAKMLHKVVVIPNKCRATWCEVNVPFQKKTYKGWVRKQYLWGVLANELFEE